MTVIDSLLVKLSLDSKDFQKGSKDVEAGFKRTKASADKTGKDIEQSGKQGAEFFNQLRKSAVQFFSVLTVGRGLADFTRNVIGTGASLDRMATRIGESASNLSRWQGAVRQSGGSAEGFLATVQGISNQMTQLQLTGDAPMVMLLQKLGVAAVDSTGKAKPILQLINDIGSSLDDKRWSNADKFNQLLAAGFDDGTINLLLKGRQEREKLLASQKEYSDADAKAAREAQENWEKQKLEIERTTQELVIKLLPSLKQIAESMVKIAEVAVPILAGMLAGFNSLNDATGGWLLNLGLALVALKGIRGVLGFLGLGGGAAAAGGGAAAGGAGSAAGGGLVAKALGLVKGGGALAALTYSGGLNTNEDEELARRRGAAPAASGGKLSRAERNNNPGNLNFAKQTGATMEGGQGARFAKFGSMPEGVAALVNQLKRYESRGLDTLEKIIKVYAPSSENDTGAYINRLAKDMGISGSSKLDMSNPDVMKSLVRGISTHEAGRNFLSNGDVMSGLQMAGMNGGNQQSSSVSIAAVNVYTQATDANGIARDMRSAIVRQADAGMR